MSTVVKKKLKIVGMHCTSCAMNIDGELEDTTGVQKANTSYAKQVCEVEFDQEKLTETDITAIIKKAGYTANVIV